MTQRWQDTKDDKLVAPPEETLAKRRADTLSHAAETARRSADVFVDAEQDRGRTLAGLGALSGLLAMVLAACTALGLGNPLLVSLAAALAVIAPTALALLRALEGEGIVRQAGADRGFCQAIGVQARRMGELAGAIDDRHRPLDADALLNGQLDTMFRDLDRARQRLEAAGAAFGGPKDATTRTVPERLVPDRVETSVLTTDGRRYPLIIADLSTTGVVLRGNLPAITLGDVVQVGSRKVRLAGIAGPRVSFTFAAPIGLSEFNRRIIL